jgi:class 3 adenylate cyclase
MWRGASQEQAIVGETPNLAARLQGIAEPNSVVIAQSTRKLVGKLFELEDLGARDLKGIEPRFLLEIGAAVCRRCITLSAPPIVCLPG